MKQPESSDKKDDCNADVMYFDDLRVLTKPQGTGGRERGGYTPHGLMRTEKQQKLMDFVNSIKTEPSVAFECVALENVYDTKTNVDTKVVQSFDPIYRVGICKLLGSSTEFFNLIDKFFMLSFGYNEAVIRDIIAEDMKKEPKFDSWKNMLRGESFREVIQAIDSQSILNAMKRKGILFKDMVDFVIDDSGEKDKILVQIAKASRLPLKYSLRTRLQPFNCNAILFANSGCGKSLAFQRLLGKEAPQTLSAAGLFGGFTQRGNINPGLLDGEGVMVVDEAGRKIKEESDDEMPILEKALTYTESGESVRGLVTPISCKGTKSIVIIGNSDLDDSEMRGLERFITRKFTEHANNRVGRRFPIVIYRNDMPVVHKMDFDAVLVGRCRLIVDAILMQNKDVIVNALLRGLKWCSYPDKKYESYFMDVSRRFKSAVMREYTQGVAIGYSRVKFAALKIAVFDNMDSLVLTKRKKNEVFGRVMQEAKENYAYLVQEIQRSFSGIKESPYDRMVNMIDKQVPVTEIVKETGLSTATVYRYIEKVGKGAYGRKKGGI